jgi:starvation-inducible DNA-binding protein
LFAPLHAQLDQLVDLARQDSDEVAERIVTLGVPAEGLPHFIARNTRIKAIHSGFLSTQQIIEEVANRILNLVHGLRSAIQETGTSDPVSQDLLIGIAAQWEKHLWMIQSQQL